jgi:hypothetical protein
MDGVVAQVVMMLRAIIEDIDRAAVTAAHAQAEVTHAHATLTRVGQGSANRDIAAARRQTREAANRIGDGSALVSRASNDLTSYLNIVLPGAAPPRRAAESAAPTGEDLLDEGLRRSSEVPGMAGFVRRLASKAGDLQDQTKDTAQTVQAMVNVARGRHGPLGSQIPTTTPPATPPTQPVGRIDATEAAGNIVVVGLIAGVAVTRVAQVVNGWIARLREHEHEVRPERPDPGAGTP